MMPYEVWMSISEWNFLKFELELVLISGKIPSISLKKKISESHVSQLSNFEPPDL